MLLSWNRCTNGNWCNLEYIDLSKISVIGVYVIWHGAPNPKVVRVGQGDVSSRLNDHRNSNEVMKYKTNGGLYVTWANVPSNLLGGVEVFLGNLFQPLVGVRFPNVTPIPVNSPFA